MKLISSVVLVALFLPAALLAQAPAATAQPGAGRVAVVDFQRAVVENSEGKKAQEKFMGEVNKPGVYPQPEALTILKLITVAGGFTKLAAPNRATLIRQNGEKKFQMRVNLEDVMSNPAKYEDIPLKPGDVVVVPERLF